MRILIIDDDEMALELMAAVLEGAGYTTASASNAIAAAEMLNAGEAFDLIVCDMHMPLISGIDFFRELREQGNPQPFLLLTGDDPTPLLRAEPRLNACLLKDFDLEEKLPQQVAALLHPHAIPSPSCPGVA